MNLWLRIKLFFGWRPRVAGLAPNLAASSVQFGDEVRILPDKATDERGLTGKVGLVYGQTTSSVTNPTVIGDLDKDYAVNVFFEDVGKQYWFPEHLVEFVSHGAGTTVSLKGVNNQWTRNAQGGWDESPRP